MRSPQGVSKTYKDSVIFIFEDTVTQQRFVIARPVQVIVNTQNETEAEMTQDIPENDVVDGIMPACMDSIQWVQSLPDAPIPKYIRDALEDGTTQEIVDLIRTDILPDNLTNESYARHWKTVLWIEEHQKTSATISNDI
ncbi:hypothetical protein FRC02_009360 [Tulasnella sp. 418]|nr:hypothetical protein FRC02_009360 [Tulasnella sp. 418]